MTQTVLPATWYQIETVPAGLRYAGPDFTAAVDALTGLSDDAEGYAVATTNGAYDYGRSQDVEIAAMNEEWKAEEMRALLDPHADDPAYDSDFYEDN